MNFIEAVIKISQISELELCTNEPELSGNHTCICVNYRDDYRKGEFVGKLRWPVGKGGDRNRYAEVDDSLIDAIEELEAIKNKKC